MKMRKDEIAFLRLALGGDPEDRTRACVTADNRWRIHADDAPSDEWKEVWQDIIGTSVNIARMQLRGLYNPIPNLRLARAALHAYPGSLLVTWRGKREYERQMKANAAKPEHLRMVY